MGNLLTLVSVHGDGHAHRVWTRVETTYQPWSFWIPPGALVSEANGHTWSSPYPVVGLFWPNKYYQVFLLLKETGVGYYCNVIAPPRYDGERQSVTFVDLDLDVVVNSDGARTLDTEEFWRRRVGYPQAWVDAAIAAERELTSLAGRCLGPFSPATELRWRAWSARTMVPSEGVE